MIEWHSRAGAYLTGWGVVFCAEDAPQAAEGERVILAPPPVEALQTREGQRYNLDTGAWEAAPPVPDDVLWAQVRARRDALLTQTDWLTVRAQEQGQPAPAEWLAYRQALRDITAQSDPANIVWPQAPASAPQA